jgi:tetratricopeptide (TPR) repeat protein
MRPPVWAGLFPIGALLAGLTAAAAWSIRVGWADYQIRPNTIAATEKAIAFAPDNAEYSARLAQLMSDDDPQKAKDALRHAVSLNPWGARSWIDLGLRAEQEGDNATAKLCLLRAAGVDQEFLPRWTLANYYFRHDEAASFWFWAKEAVAMAYGDAQPLFRLCGRVEEDGNLIDRLEIRNPEVRAEYLSYLLGQKQVDLIGPAVHRLLDDNREADIPVLFTACERLLDAAHVDDAVDLWKRLAEAGRVPSETPVAKGPQLLANGSFTTPPTSRGFDWRLSGAEGIGVSREGEARGLRITFSGSEPEDCEVLVQLVPVRGNMQYQLRFEYRTQEIASGAGLGWRITGMGNGALLAEGPSLASEADAERQILFETPPECRLVRLAMRYHRAPGTTRTEGFLVLKHVSLLPATQVPVEGRVRK